MEFNLDILTNLKSILGDLISAELKYGWIYWRYIDINGIATENTNSGALPWFKEHNQAYNEIIKNEKMLTKYLSGIVQFWLHLSDLLKECIKK